MGNMSPSKPQQIVVPSSTITKAHSPFRMIDVGAHGKNSDGGTLSSSAFGQTLHHSALNLPSDAPLPGAEVATPFVFVGEDTFPLWRNMMRPFPRHKLSAEQRIFNYRLFWAWRMMECGFGTLASQWRLYGRVLGVSPEVAEVVVKASCILYNIIHWYSVDVRDTSSTALCTEPSTGLQPVPRSAATMHPEKQWLWERCLSPTSSHLLPATCSCVLMYHQASFWRPSASSTD